MYLSLYLKRFVCVRGSWRPNRTATYWPPLWWPSALCLSRSPGLLNRRPGGPLWWVRASSTASCHQPVWSPKPVSKLTDFLSSPSYIIVQSPTQYLPITGHRDVSLPLSLECHVWLSSSGNKCYAVHRSLSSGASVYDYTAEFYLVPYCQPSPPTPMEYATSASLEWHLWPGRRSVYYNRCMHIKFVIFHRPRFRVSYGIHDANLDKLVKGNQIKWYCEMVSNIRLSTWYHYI